MEVEAGGRCRCCCTTFVKESIGNVLDETAEEIWGGRLHRILCLSVQNRTYSFCDKEMCPLFIGRKTEGRRSEAPYREMEPAPRVLALGYDPSCNFAMLEPGAFSAMEYLRANSLYPVGVMEEFLERGIFRAGERFHMPFDGRRLEAFCRRYRRVFLFGAGRWAEKIRWYLERRGICIGGNVVTEPEPERERGRAVIGYRELRLKEDEGLIAALSERHTRECMETIRSLGREEQIFWGDFGRPAGGKES